MAFSLVGCSSGPAESARRITPEYDQAGKLTLLKYDSDGDSRVDTWSYMNGTKVVRIEIDRDGDGRVDRWEYYGADQKLEKVGFSRENDGVQDAWSYADGSGAISRIEVSTRRDGNVERIEYFENGEMVRAEEDSDGVAGMDKWEAYDGQRLASVAFDTTGRGKPDRRLIYGADGSAVMEVDPEGDGTFVAVTNSK